MGRPTQRDAGYVTSGGHDFSTSGSALATEKTKLGSAGVGWLYAPTLLGKVRIRVTPVGSGSPLFVGIGPSSEVERYLAGTKHTLITDYFGAEEQLVDGGPSRSAPGRQHFWVASTTGPGQQSLFWKPADGSWTVVVMRADGRPGSPCTRTSERACRRCRGSITACARGRRWSSWPAGCC